MNYYKKYSFSYISVILILLSTILACSEGNHTEDLPPESTETVYDILVDVDSPKGTVSRLLMGFGTIYSFEKDEMWQNGQGMMPGMLKRFNTGILRYPGGALVNRYHWNNLNGEGWKDNWNPNYDTANDKDPREYMDVDEYMMNVQAIGAEPMLGINMGSGMRYNRVQDGIDEAVALVKYCEEQGYAVRYWYLDNEPYHDGANYKMTATEYAEQINLYVPAMKAVNPDIEIIVNWKHNITSQNSALITLIEAAGSHIDIVEVHWYWQWGESSFNLWKDNSPMSTKNKWYNGGSYAEEIKAFKPLMSSLGYPDIKLASNEWNIGPSASEASYPSKFESALMQSEMFSQYIDAGMHMACFWGAYWPLVEQGTNTVNRYLLDPTNDYSQNPSVTMFELFADAMGTEQVECRSMISDVYDIAMQDDVNDQLIIYVLNKKNSGESLPTGIKIKGYEIGTVNATSFVDIPEAENHLATTDVNVEEDRLILHLPQNSLTKIVVKR
ncbi:hypothetical protein [Carboxylicivirga sp. RSCT41]|uniref:hypothetical protein n=1 Tax=Carboxylicivirga agarovorans TaxID=3417570 RepID=UPI003D330807